MLYNYSSLESLNIYNWNIKKIEKTDYMFYNCEHLINSVLFHLIFKKKIVLIFDNLNIFKKLTIIISIVKNEDKIELFNDIFVENN